MASNWIKVEVITPDKPEIFQLAEILNIDPDTVLGKLIRVWVWADQQIIDGNADGNAVSVTKTALDRITFMSGFADALIAIGWLKNDGDKMHFPNFERHNGKGSKKRALTNDRVTNLRQSKREGNKKCNASGVTPPLQKALPEEEEEEDLKNKKILYTSDFETFWQEYPTRAGGADKMGAFKSWKARLKEGVDANMMLAGAKRYALFVSATNKIDTEFVKQAKTFLGPSRHYEEAWIIPVAHACNDLGVSMPDESIPDGFRG